MNYQIGQSIIAERDLFMENGPRAGMRCFTAGQEYRLARAGDDLAAAIDDLGELHWMGAAGDAWRRNFRLAHSQFSGSWCKRGDWVKQIEAGTAFT